MRHPVLRTISQWLVTALAAFTLVLFLWLVRPGAWLTRGLMAEVVGAALLGKLSWEVEKAVVRRIRSCRQRSDA